MIGYALDSALQGMGRGKLAQRALGSNMTLVPTAAGRLRVFDSGGGKPAILITPDGPCVIEHYATLIDELSPTYRVIIFDAPGFGFSFPALGYRYGVRETAKVIGQLLDALQINKSSLAFSCGNGFFALAFAKQFPARVDRLILSQTPSLDAMRAWTERVIPRPLKLTVVGQLLMSRAKSKFSRTWFDAALPKKSDSRPFFVEHACRAVENGGCFCLASLVQGLSRTQQEDVFGVPHPTLVIYGNRDRTHRQTDFNSFRELVPQANLVCFDGCGHLPDLEDPGRFTTAVNEFLQ